MLFRSNMLLGQGGMLSFGHAVYAGLGAFIAIHTLNLVGKGSLGVPVSLIPVLGGLAGALFAIGWTPCVGPTFGVILNLTYADGGTAARGALLALCYALGLGIPFVVVALAYNRTVGALKWVRRHQAVVMRVGGLFLVAIGLLMVTGWWDHLVQWAQLRTVAFGETAV